MSDTDEGAPEVPEAAPAPEPAPAPVSDAPWAQELASTFSDDQIRQQVDGFLRESVQPYVTKLEQESVGNRDANRLWNDFAESPIDTYVGVTRELFGEEVAQRIAHSLENDDDFEPEVPEVNPLAIDEDELPEGVREAVSWYQEQQQAQAWDAEMARVQEDHPELEFDEKLFNPFVVAADGDFDVAVAGYEDFIKTAQERFGLSVGDLGDMQTPPVIDSESSAPSTPPQVKKYESLDDAMDDFFAEKNAPPPVVGSS